MQALNLTSKVILVTGAAGRIGSAVTRMSLQQGAHVIAADISLAGLKSISDSLSPHCYSKLTPITVDLTNTAAISSIIDNSATSLGRIDGIVHAAYPRSLKWGTSFEDLQPEFLTQDLSLQLGGAILISQAAYRLFSKQGGGTLVHVSSIQGVRAPKFEHYANTGMSSPVEYAAIKSGIISITRWLAKYSANKNIRVNCVSPGGILDAQPEDFLHRYRQSCTNFGMLSAEQVASVIVFLLSPNAAAINGQNIIVDDGWTL